MINFNSNLVRIYLAVGGIICVLYVTGAMAGWKLPAMPAFSGSGYSSGYSSYRSSGGSWGGGK